MIASVFETILVRNGKPIELSDHVKRLEEATGVNAEIFIKQKIEYSSGYKRFRVDFSATKGLEAHIQSIDQPTIFDNRFDEHTLKSVHLNGHYGQSGFGHKKLSNRQMLEKLERNVIPHTALMVDKDSLVLETTRHSIFAIFDGVLITPPLDGRILPGIARQTVIKIAHSHRLKVEEKPITCDSLLSSDGILLSNSIIGLAWVTRYENQLYRNIPEAAKLLRTELAKKWQSEG